jgi:hypothetical protein
MPFQNFSATRFYDRYTNATIATRDLGTFEDDLAKMTLPYRSVNGIIGKNGIPKLISATGEVKGTSRVHFKDGSLQMSHTLGDDSFQIDEQAKTITFSYLQQPYRPLGALEAIPEAQGSTPLCALGGA